MFESYDDLLDVETVQRMLHISRGRVYELLQVKSRIGPVDKVALQPHLW